MRIDFKSIRLNIVKEAAKDYKYLLSRGYNWNTSLNFVSARYQLTRVERMILLRSVFSNQDIAIRKSKLKPISYIKDKSLSIDGFNVLMTIRAALLKTPLIYCQDGFIRDILSAFERIKIDTLMYISLELLLSLLLKYKPRDVVFFFDSRVSKSGIFASHVRRRLKQLNFNGNALAVPKADIQTISYGEVVASSDSVIILRANQVVDLGGYLASIISAESILII